MCFVDEAGCTGLLPSPTADIQPLFVVGGLFLAQYELPDLTKEFLQLKGQFFPDQMGQGPFLGRMLVEIKGSKLRKACAEGGRRPRRRAVAFLHKAIDLVSDRGGRFVARIWVKGVGARMDGRAVYTSSLQWICQQFQRHLTESNEQGMVIADARGETANVNATHSIFTQKHQTGGDNYNRILETPTFGHSNNHCGLQLADLLCSALLFPMAIYSYCEGHIQNVHVRPGYRGVKESFARRVSALQYRYFDDASVKWAGGVVVSDGLLKKRTGAVLFR